MVIKSLELKNFRNYESLSIDFDEGTNILYGENAQGKTNILESLYVSGTSKSHRGSKDREMISFEKEEAHIKTVVKKNDSFHQIDFHLKKNSSKGIAVNKMPIRKAGELFGILNIVFFSPEDLNVIKEGPSGRRRFLDMELSQLDRVYLHNLTSYHRIMQQRNKLLKDIFFRPELKKTLSVWDEQLISYGKKIILQREDFLRELEKIVYGIHKNISGGRENLVLNYEPSATAEQLGREMEKARERDLRMGITAVGPHRDDISFMANGTDIRKFGSQGQQRTCALSLKMAEIELVKKMIHDTPVLLLDDVLSELDSSRQNYLLNSIHDIQTIITCTGLDEFIKNRFRINKVFFVKNGRVFEK